MIKGELTQDVKKVPVVEYEVPKRILTRHDEQTGLEDNLLAKIWKFE